MKARYLLVYLSALVFAIGVAFVTRKLMMPSMGKEVVRVLVAKRNLSVGTKVAMEDFVWQKWPEEGINPLFITESNKNALSRIPDSWVRYAVVKGEPFLASKFVRSSEKSLLSAVIAPGKRAFTLQMGKRANMTLLISPGDLVDVVVAIRGSARGEGTFAQTIIRKAPIIAVDGKLSRDEASKALIAPEEITIEITPQQAEKLTAAMRDSKPVVTVYSLSSAASAALEAESLTREEDKNRPSPETDSAPASVSRIEPPAPRVPSRIISLLRGTDKKDINLEQDPNDKTFKTSQGRTHHDKTH